MANYSVWILAGVCILALVQSDYMSNYRYQRPSSYGYYNKRYYRPKTIIKKVAVPIIKHVPVYKTIIKRVPVVKVKQVPVYKKVEVVKEVPRPVKVEVPVRIPYPVEVPVEVPVEKHIPVPVPGDVGTAPASHGPAFIQPHVIGKGCSEITSRL
uniref:Zinc finger protein 512B n=1 Tax=Magallana gigas TaxID=29159 RepID=A0A8W8NUM5_MAGGI